MTQTVSENKANHWLAISFLIIYTDIEFKNIKEKNVKINYVKHYSHLLQEGLLQLMSGDSFYLWMHT